MSIKKFKISYMPIISAIILLIIGLLLLIFPQTFLHSLELILGILFLVLGIEQIAYSIFSKDRILIPSFNLTQGIVHLALAILLLFRPNLSQTVFGIIVGVWVISSATLKLNVVIQKSNLKLPWGWDLVDCLIKFALGIILILKPFKGFALWTMFAGGYFIVIAIDFLITAFYLDKLFQPVKEEKKKRRNKKKQ